MSRVHGACAEACEGPCAGGLCQGLLRGCKHALSGGRTRRVAGRGGEGAHERQTRHVMLSTGVHLVGGMQGDELGPW